ncbi:oligopeptide/dipeptide ABC transporter ATP-binding protein [Paracraurococcus lichenis]|uniref:ABC transporter ATP-binding protein n=1 Tax=Paracraurococcus lichenis TaxID=3064888 RepID=A0ABT9E973_9PROT|nr:ABC transporter ATP-binding protein [Paracraurococcus sp. LOR1-02]MDO9712649.1 ABC transporter ATP-binding protein [Paracraurococcus sp. LOR1-02]
MAEAPLVDVQNVSVRFRRRRTGLAGLLGPPATFRAVANAALTVARREVVGLVGESGSGKTTLGRTILRLVEPSEGNILFQGEPITHLREGALRRVWGRMALVFQDPLSSFNPRRSVGAALATPLMLAGLPKSERQDRVAASLQRVRLPREVAERFPHELSGGQLQRAALARALMLDPAFIVADEAVSKLDVSVRSQILNLFKDIQQELETSFLFITHDLHVARFLCDRVAVMFFGRIVEVAPAAQLFRMPRHPYTRALLATLDDAGERTGQRSAVDQEAPGCIYRSQCPRRIKRCDEAHPPTLMAGPGHALACHNPG